MGRGNSSSGRRGGHQILDPEPGRSRSHSEDCRRRSEEHTSELQSQSNLVCRLLLEKKKITRTRSHLLPLICYCTKSILRLTLSQSTSPSSVISSHKLSRYRTRHVKSMSTGWCEQCC